MSARPARRSQAGQASDASPAANVPRRPSPARAIPRAKPRVAEPQPAAPSPAPPTAPPPAPPVTPPIEWHARTATGEPLGPGSEAALVEWLATGRLTADSYVWRTGWEEWKRVEFATADLPQATPTGAPLLPTAVPASPGTKPPGQSAAQRYAKRRRAAGRRLMFGVTMLGIATIALGGVLAWVLIAKQSPSSQPTFADDPVEERDEISQN